MEDDIQNYSPSVMFRWTPCIKTYNSEVNNHKIPLVPKCVLYFLCFQKYRKYEEFRSDLDNFGFIQ